MNKRIILLEPSSVITQLYLSQLQPLGLEVECCETINECLLITEHALPDLILCSLELRDGTGIELCEQLKRSAKSVLIPVIILSSQTTKDLEERAYKAGASDFIDKSSGLDFITQRINSAIFHHCTIPYETRNNTRACRVLIAEDSATQRALFTDYLAPLGHQLVLCNDGEEAWETLLKERDHIDLVMTDINMPRINGSELCHLIRANSAFDHVPIIVVTSTTDKTALTGLLQRGVNDYLTKPFCSEELLARLRVHLRNRMLFKEQQHLHMELQRFNLNLEKQIQERTTDLQDANISTIYKLAVVCDHKDQDTAFHINRVRYYVEELALALGHADKRAHEMGYSSMMHDIGKVSIPDHILNKQGRLSDEEWRIMQTHTHKGAEILGEKPFFKVAREIALYHHEKFDGSGYPLGLAGEAIPLPARMIAVVDVFDALTSERSYKQAWSIEDALAELKKLAGHHLDPILVDAFTNLQQSGDLDYIRHRYPVNSAPEQKDKLQVPCG